MSASLLQRRGGAATTPWWSPGTFSSKVELAIHQTISAACTTSPVQVFKKLDVFSWLPWWAWLATLTVVAVTVVMVRIIYKRLTKDESYSYRLLGKTQSSFERAIAQIPNDYRLLASIWLAAGLQFIDVISDMQAIATMLHNPGGHGYALTNITAIFLVAPLVAQIGSRGPRHPVLPSARWMLLFHILQVPGPVLASIATRQILWSPLRGKTELRQGPFRGDLQASMDEYEALKVMQTEVMAVGLIEATVEGATSMLVQALFLLQQELTVRSARSIYASLLVSLLSTAMAFAETDKEGKVVRYIKRPELKEAQVHVAVVAGRIPVLSRGFVLIVIFRALDIASFVSSLLLLHVSIKGRWWPRQWCPALSSLLLGAFLARLLLFGSQNREVASLYRAATSMVSFAGPIMLPLSFPFIGLSAASFYAWRLVEALCSGGLIFWTANSAEMTHRLVVTWTWACASMAMWLGYLAIARFRPALSQEPTRCLKESYLNAVLSEGERFDPWPWWLRHEQGTYLAQFCAPRREVEEGAQREPGGALESPYASKGESDPEPEVFRGVAALTRALHCSRGLQSVHLYGSEQDRPEERWLIADGLRHCPQLRSIRFSHISLLGQPAAAIADSLKHCPQLLSLSLENTKLGPEGSRAIADGLLHCAQLQSLAIVRDESGSEGAKAIADGLQHWPHLQSLDLSGNPLSLEGAKALAGGLRHSPALHSLSLHSKDHEPEVVEAIAECFQHCPQLKSLSFRIYSEHVHTGVKTIADGLRQCPELRSLNLSRNKLGPEGARAIANGLKHWPQLQSLSLYDCGLDAEGAKALRDGLQRCPELRSLDIGENDAFAIADVLQRCPQLHSLSLLNTKLRDEGATEAIADGLLQQCSQLHSLNLGRCCHGPETARALAESLKHCPQLRSLDLSGHGFIYELGLEGAKHIAKGLRHWPQLQSLNLSKNRFGAEGVKALADGLRHCPQLRSLSLDENALGNEGAKAIADGLQHCPQLESLNLHFQSLGMIDSEGAKAIADGLQHWPQLQSLDLSSNEVGDKGADALASGLRKYCPYLKSLSLGPLSGNHIAAPSGAIWIPYLMSSSSLRSVSLGSEGRSSLAAGGGMRSCESQLHGVEDLQLQASGKNPILSCFLRFQLHQLRSVRHLSLRDKSYFSPAPPIVLDEGFALALQSLLHLQTLVIEDGGSIVSGAVADGLQHCPQLQSLIMKSCSLSPKIADGIQHCPQLQSLDFSRSHFDAEIVKALAHGLQYCPELRSLNLGWNDRIGSEGAKAIANGLANWPELQSLNLRNIGLAAQGAKVIRDGLQGCPQLSSLNLGWNHLGLEGATVIADGLRHCPQLRSLNLYSSKLGIAGVQAIANGLQHCPQLQSLDLGDNYHGLEGAKAIADLLQHLPQLQSLDLDECGLGPDAARAIAASVQQHCQQMQSIDLSQNPLSVDGVKAIADGLKHCRQLQSLRLVRCGPGAQGARAIAEGLQHWTQLRSLDLREGGITTVGLKMVVESLKHCPQLQCLGLWGNGIGPEEAKLVADGLQHWPELQSLNLARNALGVEGAKALAKGLRHCSQLQSLNLYHTDLGAEGAKVIADGLRQCSQLQTLKLDMNELTVEGAEAVSDNIQHWPQLQDLDLKD